ncbi:MAG: hypothetical protein WBL43_24510, partial [Pseudolabrys sp.]
QFQERSGSLKGQVQILDAKIDQYRSEIEGLKQERSGTANQLKGTSNNDDFVVGSSAAVA